LLEEIIFCNFCEGAKTIGPLKVLFIGKPGFLVRRFFSMRIVFNTHFGRLLSVKWSMLEKFWKFFTSEELKEAGQPKSLPGNFLRRLPVKIPTKRFFNGFVVNFYLSFFAKLGRQKP